MSSELSKEFAKIEAEIKQVKSLMDEANKASPKSKEVKAYHKEW